MSDVPLKIRIVGLLLFWLVNSVAFLVISTLIPGQLVVGNVSLSPTTAAFLSGLLLAVAVMLVEPALNTLKIKVAKQASWGLIYLVVNAEVIWAMGRLADFTGIGLASFWVAILLGVVVTLLQWGVWLGLKDRVS